MVRLCWRGIPVVMVPVRVIYPPGNSSNFRPWRDNLSINWMHTRLVLGMLARVASGRMRRAQNPADRSGHWAGLSELGLSAGIRFCLAAYRLIGRRGSKAVIAVAVTYYYLTAHDRRRASRQFLERAFAAAGRTSRPGFRDGWRHFMQFADRILDTLIAWSGRLPAELVQMDDSAAAADLVRDPAGGMLIVGHLGNADLSRAMLDPAARARLVVLTHTAHAANFNRILREIAPQSATNVLQVSEIGPDTAIVLRDLIARGCWVVIAGDRTPLHSQHSVARVPFMGAPAPFALGPYILAALMECPVWLVFCRKTNGRYRMHIERFAGRIELPRGRREAALAAYAERYAERLQAHALLDPFQWYNFYDFWAG